MDDLKSNDVPHDAITCIANKVDLGTPLLHNEWGIQVLSNTLKEPGCSRKVFATFLTNLFELHTSGSITTGVKCIDPSPPRVQIRENKSTNWYCALV